jgi:hypothetical protein
MLRDHMVFPPGAYSEDELWTHDYGPLKYEQVPQILGKSALARAMEMAYARGLQQGLALAQEMGDEDAIKAASYDVYEYRSKLHDAYTAESYWAMDKWGDVMNDLFLKHMGHDRG